ncbi:MAG TPA: ATP synthase F1 subunit delta [Actinomycetota bacterium]|nr:ATP synthase F1 subunit delta [Actinomycetota bacterium]
MANVMSEDLIRGYATALFTVVQAEGEIDRVEDELFRFGKLLETNNELKQALSDQSVDRDQRKKVLDELLADKVSPHTLGLIGFVVDQGRGRQLPQILSQLADLAAESRDSVVAEVRSAIALDDTQKQSLAQALSKATKKKVEVKVIVDESLIGGIVAKVGDTVIDGTVKRRLEQLKEQVRG